MRWLTKIQKAIQGLSFNICAVSMFLLLPMMFLTTADVVGRAFFARPLSGVVELSEYMLAVIILLGLAYTQQVKGHARVNLIVSRLPFKIQALLKIFITLLSMFILFIVIWQGWVLATGRMATIVSTVLKIPQLPFRLLVSIGGGLLFLELLVELFQAAAKLWGQDARELRSKPK